jgi:3-methyladenine DNA glycosylase AlkC
VVKCDPTLAKETFELLKPLIQDESWNIRKAVASILQEVVKSYPSAVKEALLSLNTLLQDSICFVRTAAAEAAANALL